MTTRTLLWQEADGIGLEHLLLNETDNGVSVESSVIGIDENTPFCVHYQIQCSIDYQVKTVNVRLSGGKSVNLSTDGAGNWFDATNKRLTNLTGCIDIDITATPFTNTLPIRRVTWEVGQKREFLMTYFVIPTLDIYADPQRYTCLERHSDRSVFLFEALNTGFTAQITVDSDGFVVDYPELFKRVNLTA
jgi:uncharacterized protein